MKKTVFLITLLFFTNFAWSQAATTNSGYAACVSEEWLDDFTSFVNAKDNASMQAYLSSNKCVSLKSGLNVTLVDTSGFLASKVQFVFQGVKFWTYREALNL